MASTKRKKMFYVNLALMQWFIPFQADICNIVLLKSLFLKKQQKKKKLAHWSLKHVRTSNYESIIRIYLCYLFSNWQFIWVLRFCAFLFTKLNNLVFVCCQASFESLLLVTFTNLPKILFLNVYKHCLQLPQDLNLKKEKKNANYISTL